TNARINTLAVVGTALWAGTGGGGIFISDLTARPVAAVSAASFDKGELATGMIASAFGSELATTTQTAASAPLPSQLAGTQLFVKDSLGRERLAPLFTVSPNQINFLMPSDLFTGAAVISVVNAEGKISIGEVQIARVAPGLFSANANGQDVAAA